MYADISRNSHDPNKPRTRLWSQQGRAPTEAEENEQVDLLLEGLRRQAMYALGPYWGPAYVPWLAEGKGPGFVVDLVAKDDEINIGPGIYVIRGLTVVNGKKQSFRQDVKPRDIKTPFVIAIEAWEKIVTPHEDPSLVDPALGSWDSALRAEVAWAVRVITGANPGLKETATRGIEKLTISVNDMNKLKAIDVITGAPSKLQDALAAAQKLIVDAATALRLTAKDLYPLQSVFRDAIREAMKVEAIANFKESLPPAASDALAQLKTFDALLLAAGLVPEANVRGRLRATTSLPPPPESKKDDCAPEAEASYRGHEARCYRVEIHRGGLAYTDDPYQRLLWKWSRDNGSVTVGVAQVQVGEGKPAGADPALYQISIHAPSLSADPRLGLRKGQVVELVTPKLNLPATFPLLRVAKADPEHGQLGLEAWLTAADVMRLRPLADSPPGSELAGAFLRRWDHRGQFHEDDHSLDNLLATPFAVKDPGPMFSDNAPYSTFLELEDGVFIEFENNPEPEKNPTREYRRGDYWLIPARENVGIEWPAFDPTKAPSDDDPRGFQPPRNPPPAIAPLRIIDASEVECRRVAPIASLVV